MTTEGQSWVLWMLMEGAITVYLIFILIYMSLTFQGCTSADSVNATVGPVVDYGDHGLDIGMTAFVSAAALLCFIFAILFTINHFNILVGYDRLILVGLIVSMVSLATGLIVFIPLILLQHRESGPRLTMLRARRCFHEWHIGVIVLAALSLVALIVTIILFVLRQLEKLPVTWLVSKQNGEEDAENQEPSKAKRPSTAGLSKVHTETAHSSDDSQTPRYQHDQLNYQHSMLQHAQSTGMSVQKVDTPRRLPPLRGRRVSPEPLPGPLPEISPKKKKKKKKKKLEREEIEYSQDEMAEDSKRRKKKNRKKGDSYDPNHEETEEF